MAKLEIMEDLPKRKSKNYKRKNCPCLIYWKSRMVNLPRGLTMKTDNLRPGELIHMDFCFLDVESIRKFTCTLVVVDAKTRKMWIFNTQGKRPPLDTVRFFLNN